MNWRTCANMLSLSYILYFFFFLHSQFGIFVLEFSQFDFYFGYSTLLMDAITLNSALYVDSAAVESTECVCVSVYDNKTTAHILCYRSDAWASCCRKKNYFFMREKTNKGFFCKTSSTHVFTYLHEYSYNTYVSRYTYAALFMAEHKTIKSDDCIRSLDAFG